MSDVRIHDSWKKVLIDDFNSLYFQTLSKFIKDEYKKQIIYPNPKDIFKAFDLCPFDDIRVIILGQDPYHGPGQANGLAFAVSQDISIPPSLRNIFKEIESDLGYETENKNGDLSRWAKQGVFLLNSTLTVRKDNPGSHQGKGWEDFTSSVISKLSKEKENLVFILWGAYAREKGSIIDKSKHLVIESPHPSPFSADRGFFGSKPFSKTNEYLRKFNKKEIDWK